MEEYLIKHGGKRPPKRIESLLKEKDPKVIENPKQTLFLYGKHTSQIVKNVMRDFVS